jgi:hypothetical protein
MKGNTVEIVACFALSGCAASQANLATADDAKCKSYGATVGSPAYVQCRTQLDTARTQAAATVAAAPVDLPKFPTPAFTPVAPLPPLQGVGQ